MKPRLSRDEIAALLDYDPLTGIFVWKLRPNPNQLRGIWQFNGRFAGKRAGNPCESRPGQAHWQIRIGRVHYKAHRIAWLLMTGAWPKQQIDHRDLDALNNRWFNLREATNSLNNANKPGWSWAGLPKGVSQFGNRYVSEIQVNGCRRRLGRFDSAEEAHAAYCEAAKKHFGEFARFDSRS